MRDRRRERRIVAGCAAHRPRNQLGSMRKAGGGEASERQGSALLCVTAVASAASSPDAQRIGPSHSS